MAGLRNRFATRLVAGIVLALVPLVALLAVLLVRNASDSLDDAARAGLRNSAVQIAQRVDARFALRRETLRGLARLLRDGGDPQRVVQAFAGSFETLQLVGLDGRLLAASDGSLSLGERSAEWFVGAERGAETTAPPQDVGGTLRTLLAQPVRNDAGEVRALLVGDLDESVLAGFTTSFRLGRTGEAVIRDGRGRLLWRTGLGRARSPREMAQREPLADRTTDGAVGRALEGDVGAAEVQQGGREVLSGFAPAGRAGWAVNVRQDTEEAFSPIDDQRNLALLVGLLGALFAGTFATFFASRTTRPLRQLAAAARRGAEGDLTVRVHAEGAAEVRDLGDSFNQMVAGLERVARQLRAAGADLAASSAELSSSAQELATTVAEQTTSATQTSTTMQELATTTASIADNVGGVERRAADTREALAAADGDIQRSSERTLVLAERTAEIRAILALINEIADRTNLLALNAAIEAARAGEAGAGFSVVADEVRRLAERSKAEAQKIGEIVAGTQDETQATVMAMEAGSKQMRRGRELMEEVADAVTQVRFTTDEQRVATEQVVEAMTSVTSTSRQTSTASSQIASAATQIARLAKQLDQAAGAFRVGAADLPDPAPEPPAPRADAQPRTADLADDLPREGGHRNGRAETHDRAWRP
jgi:methyl-accepting chemotaxis protein